MTIRNRKAIVSEDGQSIEVYSKGKRYVIALGFSVWEWIRVVKGGNNLPRPTRKARFLRHNKPLDASQTISKENSP